MSTPTPKVIVGTAPRLRPRSQCGQHPDYDPTTIPTPGCPACEKSYLEGMRTNRVLSIKLRLFDDFAVVPDPQGGSRTEKNPGFAFFHATLTHLSDADSGCPMQTAVESPRFTLEDTAVARAAHTLLDNTEDDGDNLTLGFREDADALDLALDALETLPEPGPNIFGTGPAKAEAALGLGDYTK